MQGIHGDLLIGGMSLKHLQCDIEPESAKQSAVWSGRLIITAALRDALEIGRVYRLELDDGRSGQLVLTDVHAGEESREVLLAEFEGQSTLE